MTAATALLHHTFPSHATGTTFNFMAAKSTAKHVSVSECRNVKTVDMQ
jgi:hypothetical protein